MIINVFHIVMKDARYVLNFQWIYLIKNVLNVKKDIL